jgi:major membrane immunogen (membrane-anchored lipoprotein)
MIKRITLALVIAALCLALAGCGRIGDGHGLVDGYYTVEMAEYQSGWKEFVTVCVSGGEIVTVEYNARNLSGYIKSWDMDYMRRMNGNVGNYPNAYTRNYAAQLLNTQGPEGIDTVSGATHSGGNFTRMAAALLEKAKAGDMTIGIVQ